MRAALAQLLVGGGYLFVLVIAASLESADAWRIAGGSVALLALLAWRLALKRSRVVSDTPTSRIVSAAQGYVELIGRGLPPEGLPLMAPLTGQPCLWFRYSIEREKNDKWHTEKQETSTASFLINDGSGECAVDPEEAEIIPQHSKTWTEGDHRYTEALLLPGESIYVLGEFRTSGGTTLALDTRQDMAHLINTWKQDMPHLLRRYDRDGDGTLTEQEWEQVRTDAAQEVAQQHHTLRSTPDSHAIGRPPDGKPFIISSLPPDKIERRFRWLAYAHAAAFVTALVGLGSSLRG